MRDEIRSILGDADDEPLRPVGITPGGPHDEVGQDLDHKVLDNLLSDLRQDHEEGSNPNSPRVRVFHSSSKKAPKPQHSGMDKMDRKEDSMDTVPMESNEKYYDQVMAKMASPQFGVSANSMVNQAKRTFTSSTTNKKKPKRNKMNTSFTANRTSLPPASPEMDDLDLTSNLSANNGNDYGQKRVASPLDGYQQKLNYQQRQQQERMKAMQANKSRNQSGYGVYEDEPMSPAIQQQKAARRSPHIGGNQNNPQNRVQQLSSAPKLVEEPVKYSPPVVVPGSPGVAPSSLMGRAVNSNKLCFH